MTIKRFESGPRMSQAVVHNGLVYLAGQVGEPGASIEDQTHHALSEIDRLLALAGTDKSKLLSTTLWLADMADFAAVNAIWEQWIDPQNPPTRATGEVKLVTPDYKVEVIAVAAV